MELIFIRHAQPEWVREGVNLIDPPLTELGRAQAQQLGAAVRAWKKPTALFASPTRRTRETVEPIAAALGMEPEIVEWFREIELPPSWEGAPAEIVGRYLSEARHRTPEEWWDGMPGGGESFHDFYERISGNLTALLGRFGATRPEPLVHQSVWNVARDEERIVLVGHGGSNSASISFLLGLEPVPWPWERFVSHHASVSRLKASRLLGARIFGLRAMSDVSHLTSEMQTR